MFNTYMYTHTNPLSSALLYQYCGNYTQQFNIRYRVADVQYMYMYMYTHTNPLSSALLYQYCGNCTQQFNHYSFLKFNLCYQYTVAGITGTYMYRCYNESNKYPCMYTIQNYSASPRPSLSPGYL